LIPTPEQLEEISRLREGTLAKVPFAALLLALSIHRRTLQFEVRRKQLSKKIAIENGVPIDCRSNLVHETLGRYMVAQGKLAPEDIHTYLGLSASLGLPLGEVLLDHGVITAEELYKLLQQNLAKKLLDVFTWRDGEFRVVAEATSAESPLKIRVPQLILTGITKFAPQEEVDAGVVPLIGKNLCLHPKPRFALEEIRLNQRQGQVAVALRSGWRIDELALGTAMQYEELTRLLYALALLGVVISTDHPAAVQARRDTRGAAAPSSPAATGSLRATSPATRPAAAASATADAPATPATPAAPAFPATPAFPAVPATVSAPAVAVSPATQASPVHPVSPATQAPQATATRPMPILRAAPASPSPPPAAATVQEAAPGANLDAAGGEGSPTATRAAPSPSTAPTAAAAPAAAASSDAAGAAALERRRNEIIQAYLSYRRLDAFDLLSVDEEASPGAVEHRYLDFARRFAPWALGGPELADMEEQARDLFLAGARAYSELLDLELRNALLFRRKSRREERDRRPAADLHAIKTDLLDPEVQYRKGRALADAGKFQEAAVLFEFAADCDPQNGLYSAELAYSRFCNAPGQGVKALKELHETLRRDPDCGLAVYYSGEIHHRMGDREAAEKMLRRAIKMMAPDRRPIEALKALSAERRR
jgi:hypothetical protein